MSTKVESLHTYIYIYIYIQYTLTLKQRMINLLWKRRARLGDERLMAKLTSSEHFLILFSENRWVKRWEAHFLVGEWERERERERKKNDMYMTHASFPWASLLHKYNNLTSCDFIYWQAYVIRSYILQNASSSQYTRLPSPSSSLWNLQHPQFLDLYVWTHSQPWKKSIWNMHDE
jgi:hypothetical protein